MNEKVNEALEQIPDEYIQEAATHKKRRIPWYFGPIAAVLALVIILAALNPFSSAPAAPSGDPPAVHNPANTDPSGSYTSPITPPSNYYSMLLAAPSYPKMAPYVEDGPGWEAWRDSYKAQYSQPEGYADGLEQFFTEGIAQFLGTSDGGNTVCSPVNIYMALAMLAECTDGSSRQQILELLGVESIQELRQQAGYVWNAHYRDDGLAKLLMANSLWLDEEHSFKQNTVDLLAENYYAAVFHGDLGTESANQALRSWINEQTGGLLKDQVSDISLDPLTVLALASTIEYRVDWDSKFNEGRNIDAPFHGIGGDTTATFMRKSKNGALFVGENFSAIALPLADGSNMWLILPDEGVTPETLLAEKIAVSMAMGSREGISWEGKMINLSLPKFDVVSKADLIPAVQAMGVTDIFNLESADFGSITDEALYVNMIDHAARVTVDEEGVTAVAFTIIGAPSTGMPPEEEVDFVLDRPFLFVITSRDGLPLFTGVVNTI